MYVCNHTLPINVAKKESLLLITFKRAIPANMPPVFYTIFFKPKVERRFLIDLQLGTHPHRTPHLTKLTRFMVICYSYLEEQQHNHRKSQSLQGHSSQYVSAQNGVRNNNSFVCVRGPVHSAV